MNAPKLRFEGFSDEWTARRIDSFLEKFSKPVKVNPEQFYTEIGIRSHGKGIFHKEPIKGSALGDKRVFHIEADALVLNIVFAWEQAVARTTILEAGMIASHRFPMFLPKNQQSSTAFLKYLFLTKKGKYYLELASPGGAGRNKTLGQKNFDELLIDIPTLAEQTKIANFLTSIDDKIDQLSQKVELLTQYKKGVMQQIFSQKLRFKDDEGREFKEWEEKRLGDIATFSKGKGISKADIDENGAVLCIRYGELYTHYGETINKVKSKTNVSIKNLVLSEINDVIMPASGETQIDIATASCVQVAGVALGGDLNIIKSPENGVFLSYYLNNQKKLEIAKLAQGNSVVHLYSRQLKLLVLSLPAKEEQTKIANFLAALDDQINHASAELAAVKKHKQGLLPQMFM